MIEYILYFFVFSFIGWIFENLIGLRHHFCGDEIMGHCNICLPMLTIYGIGGITLLFIKKNMIKNNIIIFSIVSGIILTIVECICGQISSYINKRKTWNYDQFPLAICDGYVSLPVFLLWIIGSAIFFKLYDKINNIS
jgi:uncharacterized membrane protein